jgi:drug/metabolite transporter superfamily protein YnfA
MNRHVAILILLLAAVLEAGGDALIRIALHRQGVAARAVAFLLGAVVLFAYGYTVNAPPWDFGRLLGLYVVFFFVVAQVVSWAIFGQTPSRAVLMGGSLIVSGGFLIAFLQ